MRLVFFVHSIISDWNNGHVHFLRGLMASLMDRGHTVRSCELWRNWSTDNLYNDHGAAAIVEFARLFPDHWVQLYHGGERIMEDVERLTRDADAVIVHEFNEPELVGAVGQVRRLRKDFLLLFHDTHHRAVSVPHQIARLNLSAYDGVLAFGQSLAEVYRRDFDLPRVFTLHEAADTNVFYPREAEKTHDVVWIGNWGDEERSEEIRRYLMDSARELKDLRFALYGVRYPWAAVEELKAAGIDYRGWVPNHRVPEVLARARMTLHIPRAYYRQALPGIPTIRPFEALACGIPMICTPWDDREGLFRAGKDYLLVETPEQMRRTMRRLAGEAAERERLAQNGLETIRARHTCDHRAAELLDICRRLAS
ncbi:MAG: glycosyltransferase [Candidatus Zixiibacteriota bacterium]|nr:MAG: glycosyltransferase [candidate division Zixibacteria bacterium]